MWDKGLYEVIILKFILDKYVFKIGINSISKSNIVMAICLTWKGQFIEHRSSCQAVKRDLECVNPSKREKWKYVSVQWFLISERAFFLEGS